MPYKDPEKARAAQHARYLKNIEKRRAYNQAYYLANRETMLQYEHDAYQRNAEQKKATVKAYRKANPAKVNAGNKRWRLANPEKQAASEKKWGAKNRDKEREYTRRHYSKRRGAAIADLSPEQKQEIIAAAHGRCVYCPPTCPACRKGTHKLELDHLTPVSKGGNDTASNLLPSCRSCNSRKNDREPLVPVQPLLLTVAPARKKRG